MDLGSGVGDVAAELVARGARVIGVDANQELLAMAQARGIANAEFRSGDLRRPLQVGGAVDGIWCSFAVAYIPELGPTLVDWRKHLKPGGWVALTEVDDLFGHEPLEPDTKSLLAAHAGATLAANKYDFHMGRKLHSYLERSGFTISNALTLADKELSFDGPADPEVLDAWRSRFARMRGLMDFCGPAFARARDDFLSALARPDHRAVAKVCCCIGNASVQNVSIELQ